MFSQCKSELFFNHVMKEEYCSCMLVRTDVSFKMIHRSMNCTAVFYINEQFGPGLTHTHPQTHRHRHTDTTCTHTHTHCGKLVPFVQIAQAHFA
uniref:Uncharacterized protein n=1 Tax=Anguilla anguilla TaxID=7936 RepID=A0A0E9WTK9_ANGAN